MAISTIPHSTRILVIGGGPSGSYAAAALAREGFEVTVLEREHFPRYHIGESMIPSFKAFLSFIGAKEKVENRGFTVKPGAAIKLNQFKQEGYTNFVAFDKENSAWNVVRSELDEILLRHAAACGAHVYEGVSVNGIQFSSSNPLQPVAATWTMKDGQSGTISFEYLVDASGRTGVMSTKYLKNRKMNESLRNLAVWSYWRNAGMYSPGTERENAPWFEALTDESGWAWFIPLHNGTVSVGFVQEEKLIRSKKADMSVGPEENKSTKHYFEQLKSAPGLLRLLEGATCTGVVRSAGDYSYSAPQYAGPHYRIVGDAGAFIDPLFSSGVHLAFTSGLSAACTIAASIRGHCTDEEAGAFHTVKFGTSYTRFLVVVWAAYRQIKSQADPILSEVDEDNFDRAFNFLRPVIQGATEHEPSLDAKELDDAIEFCKHAIAPTDPEMRASVAQRMDPGLVALDAPIMNIRAVEAITGEDEEAKQVLWKVNSDKALGMIFTEGFRSEVMNGLIMNVERGSLGLRKA
ncbi:radh flavin-dependent halogenase [Moniliophthora roreri MCA 2997]|uniref:Radh flavin-dependent halogenase n=2 Tax=Moniliophthora roreri TaxID=221103 RepID=V2X5T7_MONRO|nr:radh flavin-dependent halogenase [Moniliophthora roreri MCA 2997]KAI3609004.1 radh flavin-dependent halogenase [Moniliophthora roreri]